MKKRDIIKWGVVTIFLTNSAYGVNLKGKFGMGPRWWGLPFISLATTRYGLTSKISIEPSLGYYRWITEYESKYHYEDTTYSYSDTLRLSLVLVAGLTNYTLRGNPKSNVYVRVGGIVGTGTWECLRYKITNKIFGWGLVIGYGLEHFVSNHFAINVGVLSCLWVIKDEYIAEAFAFKAKSSGLMFGNQLLDFTLMWYY